MTYLAAGRVLGRFRVVAPLGRGGMAAVYRAEEAGLGREVALKVLPAELMEQPGFLERFEREARVIAQLEHPNIVPLYASGIDEGIPWMALRLVTDGTLQERLEAGTLGVDEGLALFAQLARALDHAHAQGVLHRDLKPQNVLLGTDGSAYLADFGIARILSGGPALTGTGAVLGTPPYMAPEQAQGEALGPPCDRYALAVMLYRWLCGQVPFAADTPLAVLMKHVQAPVPLAPMERLPPAAREVLLRGLDKDPAQRWPSAASMVQALASALRADTTTPVAVASRSTVGLPSVATPEATARTGRRPAVFVGVSVLLVGLLAAGVSQWREESPPQQTVPISLPADDASAADQLAGAESSPSAPASVEPDDSDTSAAPASASADPGPRLAAPTTPAQRSSSPSPAKPAPAPVQAPAQVTTPPASARQADPPSIEGPRDSDVRLVEQDPVAEPPAVASSSQVQDAASAREEPVPAAKVDPPMPAIDEPRPPGSVFRDCPQCPELVVIPAGRLLMGSPADEPQRQPSEGPQREIQVAGFALAKFETRFAEWDTCLAEGGCRHRPADSGWGGGSQPLIDVSWNDVQEYLLWLSAKSGQRYRLPSEAEWEYAARGGTRGRNYRGDCFDSTSANFNARRPAQGCSAGEFRNRALAVGSFEANPFGLHDMHGNVWEWVQDCANPSHQGAPPDASPRMSGDCRQGVVRGGAWHDWGFWLRAAARYSFPRDSRHPYGGFRVLRELP